MPLEPPIKIKKSVYFLFFCKTPKSFRQPTKNSWILDFVIGCLIKLLNIYVPHSAQITKIIVKFFRFSKISIIISHISNHFNARFWKITPHFSSLPNSKTLSGSSKNVPPTRRKNPACNTVTQNSLW